MRTLRGVPGVMAGLTVEPGPHPGRGAATGNLTPSRGIIAAMNLSNGNSFGTGKTTEREAPLWRWLQQAIQDRP